MLHNQKVTPMMYRNIILAKNLNFDEFDLFSIEIIKLIQLE